MVKKIVSWLHLWLGLASSIVVFIVCVTGCLWVFHAEISKMGSPEISVVPRDTAYIQPSAMMQRLREQLPVRDDVYAPFTTVEKIRPLRDSVYPFTFYGKEAIHLYIDDREIWMDPYNGDLLAVWEWGGPYQKIFAFILEGHLELWLPHPYGHYIVRYATLIFLVLLITGLVLWWPKNKAGRKQRIWFRWKKTTQWRRKNYDLHNIPGFWTLLLTFLLAFTGLGIGLEWFSDGVHWILSGGHHHHHEHIEQEPVYSDTTMIGTDQIYYANYDMVGDSVMAIVKQKRPKSEGFGFRWPDMQDHKGVIRVFGSRVAGDNPENNYPTLLIDKYSLNVLKEEEVASPEEKDLAHQVEDLYRPIHEGRIWGLPTKILAFIGSLVGATLPVTGFYIWWGRRKKGKKKTGGVGAKRVSDKHSLTAKKKTPVLRSVPKRKIN